MKKNNKGFTLAELLIVVAIIAVLVAIAIPIFTNQLEKSRESVDAANIRSAYAEVVAAALTNPDDDASATVEAKQTQKYWQNTSIEDIAGAAVGDGDGEINAMTSGSSWDIEYSHADGTVTIGGVKVNTSFLD